jgi:uncharacterized membrane protein
MSRRTRRYAISDTSQQIVGGFLLAGPFVVTEEVWILARSMSTVQAAITVAIVFGVGYGALYKADEGRDPDREREVAGIPLRFISLILVAYVSVFILAVAFDAPMTFVETSGSPVVVGSVTVYPAVVSVTLKAVSVGAIFSVIGAATADSIY